MSPILETQDSPRRLAHEYCDRSLEDRRLDYVQDWRDLANLAKRVSARAPWVYRDVYAILEAHIDQWAQHITGIFAMEDDAALEQIEAGDLAMRQANGVVSWALLAGSRRPPAKAWTREQREEGLRKIALRRAQADSLAGKRG